MAELIEPAGPPGTAPAGNGHGVAGRLAEYITARDGESDGTSQTRIVSALRAAILAGALPPGAKLRQEELADAFGTSRIPVREALRALEYEGLVHSEPHRGFRVASLDVDDVEEIFDLRTVLESHALRLAIPLLTDEDITELGEMSAAIARAAEAAGAEAERAARERFYLRLYSVAGRPRLVGLIARLRHEVARGLRVPALQNGASVDAALWEAVRAGETDRAVSQLAAHDQRTAQLIRRYMRAEVRDRGDGRPIT